MCRFALYLGHKITLSSLVTEPAYSIIHQSYHSHEREEPLNGDGFGIAWYVPEITSQAAIFKDITPAWNNLNLINLAKVTQSQCILAHVRAATPGLPVIQLNCHPFAWGPFAFMHNGSVAGFKKLRRKLLNQLSDQAFNLISGSTDSEHVFALFVDHYLKIKAKHSRLEAMTLALSTAIKQVETLREEIGMQEASTLNLAVTDGTCAVVSRYISHHPKKANSLYVHTGSRYVHEDGTYKMINPDTGTGTVIIASEPLSQDEGWDKVKPNSLLVVNEDLQVETRSL